MASAAELKVVLSADPAIKLLERVGALLVGDFKLGSGKRSPYYFDLKKLSLDPEGAYFVAKQLTDKLMEADIVAVGGVAHGAIPIVAHLALYSYTMCPKLIPAFYVREEPKSHGTKSKLEGQLPGAGSKVAIIDDVVTTGATVREAITAAEDAGYIVERVIALLDRQEGGGEMLRKLGYNFYALYTVSRTADGELRIDFNG